MVANETGIRDVSLETVWSVYDTLFCEVSFRRNAHGFALCYVNLPLCSLNIMPKPGKKANSTINT